MALLLTPYSKWKSDSRLIHLTNLILMAHVYHTNSSTAPNVRFVPTTPHDYNAYKSALMFFALINNLYEYCFKVMRIYVYIIIISKYSYFYIFYLFTEY